MICSEPGAADEDGDAPERRGAWELGEAMAARGVLPGSASMVGVFVLRVVVVMVVVDVVVEEVVVVRWVVVRCGVVGKRLPAQMQVQGRRERVVHELLGGSGAVVVLSGRGGVVGCMRCYR